MRTRLLFPHAYRMYGCIILLSILAISIAHSYFQFIFDFLSFKRLFYKQDILGPEGNFTDELFMLGVIVSLLFIGFSKEKIEDERIAQLRLDSLQWSVYFNYIIISLAIILIHGLTFLLALNYHLFTLLIFFIIRFRWAVICENRLSSKQGYEE